MVAFVEDEAADEFVRNVVRMDLAINVRFADAAAELFLR